MEEELPPAADVLSASEVSDYRAQLNMGYAPSEAPPVASPSRSQLEFQMCVGSGVTSEVSSSHPPQVLSQQPGDTLLSGVESAYEIKSEVGRVDRALQDFSREMTENVLNRALATPSMSMTNSTLARSMRPTSSVVSDNAPVIYSQVLQTFEQNFRHADELESTTNSHRQLSEAELRDRQQHFARASNHAHSQQNMTHFSASYPHLPPGGHMDRNDSKLTTLQAIKDQDQLEQPYIYSQGMSDEGHATVDILSEVQADMPLSKADTIRPRVLQETPHQQILSPPAIRRDGPDGVGVLSPTADSLEGIVMTPQIGGRADISNSQRLGEAESGFEEEIARHEEIPEPRVEAMNIAPERKDLSQYQEEEYSSISHHAEDEEAQEVEERPTEKKAPLVASGSLVKQSLASSISRSSKKGVVIMNEEEVPELLEKLSMSGEYRQREDELQKSTKRSKFQKRSKLQSKDEIDEPEEGAGLERQTSSPTLGPHSSREQRRTVGENSQKTLPRAQMEESGSDVRILSPIPKTKTHNTLLTINSKHQIIFKPPPAPDSTIAADLGDQQEFYHQFMNQLQSESGMKVVKPGIPQPEDRVSGSASTADMNKVVQKLDRKKFEMLRNFIATPDRDVVDLLASRKRSDSGSSINTVKNAPVKGEQLLERDEATGVQMYDYIGTRSPQDYFLPEIEQTTEKRGAAAANSQIIRRKQEEESIYRRQELLKRMERVFTEQAQQPRHSEDRPSLQTTQKKRPRDYGALLHNSSSAQLRKAQAAGIHFATPITTMSSGIQGGKIVLPSTVLRERRAPPMYKSTKKAQAAAGAIRNQLYYPSALNEENLKRGRRASNEFQVHYLHSVKQAIKQRRSKVSKLKIADYFRHASVQNNPDRRMLVEPDAYYPNTRQFGAQRHSESRAERSVHAAPLIDRQHAFQSLYHQDSYFREDYDSPEGPEFPELGVPSRGTRMLAKKPQPPPPIVPRTAMSYQGVGNPKDTITSEAHDYSPEARNWYRQKYGFSPYTENDPAWRKMVTYMRKHPETLMRMLPESPGQKRDHKKYGTGQFLESPQNQQLSQSVSPYQQSSMMFQEQASIEDSPPPRELEEAQMSVELQGRMGFKPKFKVQSEAAKQVVKSNLLAKGIVERITKLFKKKLPPINQLSRQELVDIEPAIGNCSRNVEQMMQETMISIEDGGGPGMAGGREKRLIAIDWAESPLWAQYQKGLLSFNHEKDPRCYNEKDVDFILEMLKHKFKDFKKNALTRPFYSKAKRTLLRLMTDLSIENQFSQIERKYAEVSIENTLRFLIRTKLLLGARAYLIELFSLIGRRDDISLGLQKLMKRSDFDMNDELQRDELFQLNRDLKVVTSRIMKTLGALHSDYRQFKSRFVVGEKDYVKVMRDDIKEVQAMMRGLDFLISE